MRIRCLPLNAWAYLLLLCGLAVANVMAGEWPQILGPNRNGTAVDETIATAWPQAGPPVLWQRETGSGFAGAAVAGGRAVLYHRLGDEQVVEAVNATTGEVLWKAAFDTFYVPSYTHDAGPRVVPILHDGRVYLYGAESGGAFARRCTPQEETCLPTRGGPTFGRYPAKKIGRHRTASLCLSRRDESTPSES